MVPLERLGGGMRDFSIIKGQEGKGKFAGFNLGWITRGGNIGRLKGWTNVISSQDREGRGIRLCQTRECCGRWAMKEEL